MKNRHCRYSKKMQLALANFWIVSLPITLFSMEAGPEAVVQETVHAESLQSSNIPAQQQPKETVEPTEKIGTQGNWVKKREWLIKAHEVTTEIQDISVQVEKTRKLFIDAYNEIDVILDDYYKQLGLDDGKIQGLFDAIKRYLDKKQKQEIEQAQTSDELQSNIALQTKIDSIQDSIKPLKQQVSQLKLDMKSIDDLDKSLTDRIKRVDDQMNTIQEIATNSKKIAHDMWSIIDHNRAREQYYELKLSLLEKTKNLQGYLQEDLFKDFQSVIATIKTQISRTQDQIKKLESDGLFIKDRAQKLKDFKQELLEEQAKREADKEKSQETEPQKITAQQLSWTTSVYNFLANIVGYPLAFVNWIKGKIGYTVPTPASPSPAPAATPVHVEPSEASSPIAAPIVPSTAAPILPSVATPIVPHIAAPIVPALPTAPSLQFPAQQ